MVGVPDRGVAPRRPADLVAQQDEARQAALEAAAAGVHRHQLAGRWGAVEATTQGGETLLGGLVGQLPSELGRDRTLAVEVRRVVARAEEHLVADHELDLDRDDALGVPQEAFGQGVGHHLVRARGSP